MTALHIETCHAAFPDQAAAAARTGRGRAFRTHRHAANHGETPAAILEFGTRLTGIRPRAAIGDGAGVDRRRIGADGDRTAAVVAAPADLRRCSMALNPGPESRAAGVAGRHR